MKITILTVGTIKEKYLREAIAEYTKRLSRYCKLQITEVSDEKAPERASEAQKNQIKDLEGSKLLKTIREDDFVITLEIGGTMLDSEELASHIENITTYHASNIVFVIGGSLGLSKEVSNRADLKLSFSKMTFPHQLMRVILLEQIYRSFRILHNEPYHK